MAKRHNSLPSLYITRQTAGMVGNRNMIISREKQQSALIALLLLLAMLVVYRVLTAEKPRTAPLTYPRGSVARSPVRTGLLAVSGESGILNAYVAQRQEKYPGVTRDIFRMENPAPKTKPKVTAAVAAVLPLVPQKTPEEIAADLARADLARFRLLGYLSDKVKTLFLSKGEELFIVKVGDRVSKSYLVKDASHDAVTLVDTVTRVEARVDMSGGVVSQKQMIEPQQQKMLTQAAPQPQPSSVFDQERPQPSVIQNLGAQSEPHIPTQPTPEAIEDGPHVSSLRRMRVQRSGGNN